jgi:hypothetical protein
MTQVIAHVSSKVDVVAAGHEVSLLDGHFVAKRGAAASVEGSKAHARTLVRDGASRGLGRLASLRGLVPLSPRGRHDAHCVTFA